MEEIKNISIIGAGNIGVAIAVDLSLNENHSITILTSRAKNLNKSFIRIDSDTNETIIGKNIKVTDDYSEALQDCDLLLITVPSFLIKNVMEQVQNYSPKRILFVPGYGGKEFFCKKLIEKGCIIAGFERVSHIARLTEPTIVRASKKKELYLACLNKSHTLQMCKEIEKLFKIQCKPVNNYLTVTLTPSNPILHTARLYSMFKDCDFSTPLERQIQFYSEWTDDSSRLLFEMDNELQQICISFSEIDLSGVKSLPIHYESPNITALTKKISSIPSFQGILSPLKEKNGIYYIDSESRYFKEDFMFGLCNLKGFALIAGIKTQAMDTVLSWYEKISGEKFWNDKGDFSGESIKNTGVPQIFGINTKTDIYNYYGRNNE